VSPGWYEPNYPAYVVDDDPSSLTFTVVIDEQVATTDSSTGVREPLTDLRREYVTITKRCSELESSVPIASAAQSVDFTRRNCSTRPTFWLTGIRVVSRTFRTRYLSASSTMGRSTIT
jgi:hypothetical protein